ncbi:MAG: RNA polymerase sigma factor [Microbacter sp.]
MKTTLIQLSDDELVHSYYAGNQDAFKELLARHQEHVFRYILSIIRNESLANDFFQDTFVKAILFIKQNRYVHDGRFLQWIMRIAHNIVMDYFRKEQLELSIQHSEKSYDLLNDIRLADASMEDVLIQAQSENELRALIQLLPQTQKEVVMMRYYQNMSFKEIAEQTGVSINTALGRMRYALTNLRKLAEKSLSI